MAKLPGQTWGPARNPKVAKLQEYHHSRLVLDKSDKRFTLNDMLGCDTISYVF